MSQFPSPAAMASHLREIIDDEDFIQRAIRGAFPEYRADVRERAKVSRRLTEEEARRSINAGKLAYAQRNYAKPMSRFDGFYASDLADKVFKRGMENGSNTLLQAIHKEHPEIMQALKARGKAVVFP